MEKKTLQQGDVLMQNVPAIPEGARLVQPVVRNGHQVYVLAEGETTGHAHVVDATPGLTMCEKDGVLYMKNEKAMVVEHEEHNHVKVAPGTRIVAPVVEADPYEEEIRKVTD